MYTRPLFLFGAGVGLSGKADQTIDWLTHTGLPFTASWGAATYFDHSHPGFIGLHGVYGARAANFAIQQCDTLNVQGSRRDNRQTGGRLEDFARQAFCGIAPIWHVTDEWLSYINELKSAFPPSESLPAQFVRRIATLIEPNAIVVADCGANLCWVMQNFPVKKHNLFSAFGMSPMGYSIPAAIGAAIAEPNRKVVAFIGDGGFQINVQELATFTKLRLDIKIVVLNNSGFGIIRQFQDSNLEGRHLGTQEHICNIGAIAGAYGLDYTKVSSPDQLQPHHFYDSLPRVIDVQIPPDEPIIPKCEGGRLIHDQYPYLSDAEWDKWNRFVKWDRK